ncbi:MAG: ABC transporter substrate-binding protein [Lutibacter sp.]
MNFRIGILLFISGLIISCNSNKKKDDLSKVFRYNEHANISSLDPAFAKNQANIWAVNQLFSGLVQLDNRLEIKPDIAKDWKISNKGKKYQFTLRKDVYFHKSSLFGKDSTRKVNAYDFEYSFNRIINPKTASPGQWVFKNVAHLKAVNDSVFVIDLKKRFPPFLGLLSMKYCSVVPKEVVDFYGADFRSHPIGTGPFKFKLWVENTKLVFRKNELYYESIDHKKLPFLEAIAITFLPDKQSEFLEFIQGNLDFLNSIDASYKDDILTSLGELKKKYQSKIKMQKNDFLNTEYLGFYMEDTLSPIHNILIRKAINLGFDRKKMIQYLRNNIGTPAENGFIPKGLPAFNNLKGYEYNPKKALAFIHKYKMKTGNRNPKITITTNSQYVDLCEFIQRELQKIGLEIAVDVVPPSTLRQSKANGKLSLFRASWIADYPDAENYMSLFYSKNFAPNGPNYTHFKNDLFDTYYEQSFNKTNYLERLSLYRKMDSLIISEAPVVPLYYDQVVQFFQKNVKGLTPNPINLLNLKKVYKVKN